MKECWINVYKYFMDGKYYVFTGAQWFNSKYEALSYIPSIGLSVTYRIHVKLKPIKLADLSKGTEQWLK